MSIKTEPVQEEVALQDQMEKALRLQIKAKLKDWPAEIGQGTLPWRIWIWKAPEVAALLDLEAGTQRIVSEY